MWIFANSSTTVLPTPFNNPEDASSESVEVTDPGHPLFGRQFLVVSVSRGPAASAHVFIRYRDGIVLRIPVRATSLSTLVENAPQGKLSLVAVREFLSLVKECEPCPRPPRKSGSNSGRRGNKHSSKN